MTKKLQNLAIIPTKCHLWQQIEKPNAQLTTIKEYTDHFMTDADEAIRSLKKCSDCGQLYLFEFLEWIDWEDGNDPQYSKYIPVATEADADKLATLSQFEIFYQTPRLQRDFPKTATTPTEQWIK